MSEFERNFILLRSLTYQECIGRGCTEQEAIDYVKKAGRPKIYEVGEDGEHTEIKLTPEMIRGGDHADPG